MGFEIEEWKNFSLFIAWQSKSLLNGFVALKGLNIITEGVKPRILITYLVIALKKDEIGYYI